MNLSNTLLAGILVAASGALSGCTTTADHNPSDPYESFNRSMYKFNDGVDRAVLQPVAKGYRAVTNKPIREGVGNFLGNLKEPITAANQLLQGKPADAGAAAGRFVINTTLGIVGIFDTASAIGIDRKTEDFGQTLGVWGVRAGPYLVLPFLGSTNPRDLFGMVGDAAMNPINYAQFNGDDATRIGLGAANVISAREGAIETVDGVRNQVDPYTTVRRFSVRNRALAVGNMELAPIELDKVSEDELNF
jgi:phospholipid-binding lipoprotein MlaA